MCDMMECLKCGKKIDEWGTFIARVSCNIGGDYIISKSSGDIICTSCWEEIKEEIKEE